MFQDIVEASLLFDFYGQLLSERQRQVMELYYEENLSLGEIAEEFNISRQGVYDALKTAQKSLEHYEEKLGRKRDFERRQEIVSAMSHCGKYPISVSKQGFYPNPKLKCRKILNSFPRLGKI